mmetsp:Transcript_11401/g.28075  ORF Transcript_11401/g.28075 Transcript_11401/m.28075 type:complete len:191 (+) Transcript_11401:123-695(+)
MSRERRAIRVHANELEQHLEDHHAHLAECMEHDVKDVSEIFPILEKMNEKAGELHQILELYPYVSVSIDICKIQHQLLASCRLFVNQGARSHLGALYQIMAECCCDLGRLRDCKRYNDLALKFSPNDRRAAKFQEEMTELTTRHAWRGALLIAAVLGFGSLFAKMATTSFGAENRIFNNVKNRNGGTNGK